MERQEPRAKIEPEAFSIELRRNEPYVIPAPFEFSSVVVSSNRGYSLGIARLSAKGAQLRGSSLTVSGESVQLNIVVRQSNATLNGIVRRSGTPAAGVFVLLVPTDAQQTGDRAMPNQSDSDGTFNFYTVPPGNYAIVAIEEGWKLDWARADTIKPFLTHGQEVW